MPAAAPATEPTLNPGYIDDARRPISVLAFVLPLVVFYEVCALTLLDEPSRGSPLVARDLIGDLFRLFGVVGIHLPAALLVVTLVAQHLIARDRLSVSPRVVGLMVGESALWTMPLVVLAGVLGLIGLGAGSPRGIMSDAAIAVGAGLYEEFVFRLVLIAGLHLVLVEVSGVRERLADAIAVAGSAVAFASYHGLGAGGGLDPTLAGFYLAAGVLLGWLFLTRGLAIAAGAHVGYDAVVLVLLPRLGGG